MATDNAPTVQISGNGAVEAVENLGTQRIQNVFANTDPDQLEQVADQIEYRATELLDEPVNNEYEIKERLFKAILLRELARRGRNDERQDIVAEGQTESEQEAGEQDDEEPEVNQDVGQNIDEEEEEDSSDEDEDEQ